MNLAREQKDYKVKSFQGIKKTLKVAIFWDFPGSPLEDCTSGAGDMS